MSTCFYTHIHTHTYAYIYTLLVFSSEAESNKSFSTQERISINVKPCFEIESWPSMPTSHFGELKVQRPRTQVLRPGKTFCHSVSLPWYLVTPQPRQVRPLWGQSPEHEGQHWLDSLQAEVWQVCPRAVLSPLLLFVATKSALTLHHLFEICKENLLVKGLGSLIELKGNCSPASHCKEKKQLVFYKCNALFFGFFFF